GRPAESAAPGHRRRGLPPLDLVRARLQSARQQGLEGTFRYLAFVVTKPCPLVSSPVGTVCPFPAPACCQPSAPAATPGSPGAGARARLRVLVVAPRREGNNDGTPDPATLFRARWRERHTLPGSRSPRHRTRATTAERGRPPGAGAPRRPLQGAVA